MVQQWKWFQVLATSTTYRGHPANMGNVADITDRLVAQKALSLERKIRDIGGTSALWAL